MTEQPKPWAYIAHKNNCWAGVCSTSAQKDTLDKWFSEFAADGFEFKAVFSREEYQDTLKSMEMWTAQKAGVVP